MEEAPSLLAPPPSKGSYATPTSAQTNAWHVSLATAPDYIKTYWDKIIKLPTRGACKNAYKRQAVMEFHKAGESFQCDFFQQIEDFG